MKSEGFNLLIELDEQRNPIRLPNCTGDVTFACYIIRLKYSPRFEEEFDSARQLDFSPAAKSNHIPPFRRGVPVWHVTRRESDKLRACDFGFLRLFARLGILCKRASDWTQFYVNSFGMCLAVVASVYSCHRNRRALPSRDSTSWSAHDTRQDETTDKGGQS